jgi:hypothetical protein
MDCFQGVATEYLRADRAVFVNTECCIQLNPGENPDRTGPHWFCDAVAVNFREHRVYLCEVTYAKTLGALNRRLIDWATHWRSLRLALTRDCHVPGDWPVQPWLFVPNALRSALNNRLLKIMTIADSAEHMPYPKTTDLEAVAPWQYNSWNRREELHRAEAQDEASGQSDGAC